MSLVSSLTSPVVLDSALRDKPSICITCLIYVVAARRVPTELGKAKTWERMIGREIGIVKCFGLN